MIKCLRCSKRQGEYNKQVNPCFILATQPHRPRALNIDAGNSFSYAACHGHTLNLCPWERAPRAAQELRPPAKTISEMFGAFSLGGSMGQFQRENLESLLATAVRERILKAQFRGPLGGVTPAGCV